MKLTDIVKSCGFPEAVSIPFSDCRIINPGKLRRLDFTPVSVCLSYIPYYTHFCDLPHNVSSYALSRDYHLFAAETEAKISELFKNEFPGGHMKLYCDNSPIAEVDAAAKAGLGIVGEHGLLITENYSSFVFIFEIVTDMPAETLAVEAKSCEKCGKCRCACPTGMKSPDCCLSSITQKKGTLSDEEQRLILENGTVWGCDICQNVCPHTQKAIENGTIYTDIPWFEKDIIPFPDEKTIDDTELFASRAYSWRGKNTILRNINIAKGAGKVW